MPEEERQDELDERTVEELAELARELDIAGRSTMRKEELVAAIAEAERAGEDDGRDEDEDDSEQASPRRALFLALAAIGVIVIVAVVALLLFGGGSDDDGTASDVGATKSTSNTSYRLDSVRVEPALQGLRPERGVFVVVGLTVEDQSPAQGLLGGPPVLLRGGDDISYGPAAVADEALGESALAGVALTPGEASSGEVAFDVPGPALVGAELVARDLSGGGGETTFSLGVVDPIAE